MKKIIICLAALLMFAACNNQTENQANNGEGENAATSEMTTTNPEEGQDEWAKQTTIMSSKPMVVDFFATWCGPCKELAPILDEIEQNHKGEIIFKRIDVDQEPELAQEFNIQAVPTLMFITHKGEYQTIEGAVPAEVIEAKIADLLKHSAE